MTFSRGPVGHPGPKLSPKLHRACCRMHRVLHILLSLTATAILGRLSGVIGVFHVAQHAALRCDEQRLIPPGLLHPVR